MWPSTVPQCSVSPSACLALPSDIPHVRENGSLQIHWVALSCVSHQEMLALKTFVTFLCLDQLCISSSLVLAPAEVAEWLCPYFLEPSGFIDKIYDPESLASKYSDLWISRSFSNRVQWNVVQPHPWLFLKPCLQEQILNFSIIYHGEKLTMVQSFSIGSKRHMSGTVHKTDRNVNQWFLSGDPFVPQGKFGNGQDICVLDNEKEGEVGATDF